MLKYIFIILLIKYLTNKCNWNKGSISDSITIQYVYLYNAPKASFSGLLYTKKTKNKKVLSFFLKTLNFYVCVTSSVKSFHTWAAANLNPLPPYFLQFILGLLNKIRFFQRRFFWRCVICNKFRQISWQKPFKLLYANILIL